jgi:hypothetical protein
MKLTQRLQDITEMVVYTLHWDLHNAGVRSNAPLAETDEGMLHSSRAVPPGLLDGSMARMFNNCFQGTNQEFLRALRDEHDSNAAWCGARVRPLEDGIIVTMYVLFTDSPLKIEERTPGTLYESWMQFWRSDLLEPHRQTPLVGG